MTVIVLLAAIAIIALWKKGVWANVWTWMVAPGP